MHHSGRRSPFALLPACGTRGAVILLFLSACSPLPARGADDATRRILMLHAYNYMFPSTTVAADSARKRWAERSSMKIEMDGEFLDLVRTSDPTHQTRAVEFLREKYANTRLDLVMSMGGEAFPFVVKHRDAFAPGVPVVFTGVSPASYALFRPPPDITGILIELDLNKTLALAETLQPNARRLYVVAGSSALDRRWQATARRVLEGRARKFETTYLFELSYEALIAEVSRIPRDAMVLVLTVFADREGKTFVPGELVTALANRSAAPVYSPYIHMLGKGILGGFSETYESIGNAAADMVLEILEGKDPATIPPRLNPERAYRVDYQALQRWNLRESNLPTGTVVLFKPPGIWDQHRDFVLATVAIIAVLIAFIAALLVQRRRRRHAETLLKESEERMTFTAASVNAGLWQYNPETEELWATQHCRALFGLRDDNPLTRDTFLTAIHPEDRKTAVAALRDVSEQSGSAVRDVRVVLPCDRVRWISIRARAQTDGDGVQNRVNGIFVDVTEQKAAEREAAEQRQEVAHLMRVSVLGELSGAIAHEINQPLTAVQTNAETGLDLLAERSPDLAEVRDVLEDIVHDNRRASDVIERLRSMLRKGERRLDCVDIKNLIHSTIALLNSEAIARRITIEADLSGDLPAVSGDPVQLQQVLLNLVMNAMDAMDEAAPAQRVVTIGSEVARDGSVVVTVRDRGRGISTAEQSQLFRPYHTTKAHGLGLGLTICSTIVQQHGGNLTLVNNPEGGAVASFSLPAHPMLVAAK